MLFYISYQGEEHKVRVEVKDGQYFVSVGDESENLVDISFYGNDCTLLHEKGVFHANVVGEKMDYTVWIPEGNLSLTVESEYRRIVGLLRGQNLETENNVYSKMPGKITKMMAKEGDEIQKGQGLLVMEAMKMENEIKAQVAGTLKRFCVKEGQAVETGTLLAEITPNE
ncbi:acetyl-CoA carboxylase biotin carboxyl carrier protein subunit [bacterium]|nr:acetyl-CoA carboxylase biotin carboxyl carrier protein subunit [bacterium]